MQCTTDTRLSGDTAQRRWQWFHPLLLLPLLLHLLLHRHRHSQSCDRSHRHPSAAKARDFRRLRGGRSLRQPGRARSLARQMYFYGTCNASWKRSGRSRSSSLPSPQQHHTKSWASGIPAACLLQARQTVAVTTHHSSATGSRRHLRRNAATRHSCRGKCVNCCSPTASKIYSGL